jgi:hypothetical protein
VDHKVPDDGFRKAPAYSPTVTPGARTHPPVPLAGAATLVGLQALALVVLGVVEVLSADSERVALAVTTTLFFVLLAAGLGVCARGLVQVRSWARGPVVAAELVGLLLSYSFWGGETTPVALVLLAVSALALVGVLHPASTRALAAADEPDEV